MDLPRGRPAPRPLFHAAKDNRLIGEIIIFKLLFAWNSAIRRCLKLVELYLPWIQIYSYLRNVSHNYFLLLLTFRPPFPRKFFLLLLFRPSGILVNLRNRTGEERRRQTLCYKRDNNCLKQLFAKLHFHLNRSFCKGPENSDNHDKIRK